MTRSTPAAETITLHVPFRITKRGGRKEMVLPPGAPAQRPRVDNALVKALARAFRWQRMLDAGEFATVAELAEKEAIAVTYVARLLHLTLLAPAIVEMILSGRQPPTLTLAKLAAPFPDAWSEQSARWSPRAPDSEAA